MTQTARDVSETTIISRTGGAATLAVSMTQIFAAALSGKVMMVFWCHFAILFEAQFILTAVDAGTRVGRFMLQDLISTILPSFKRLPALAASLIAPFLCVGAWGYFLYQGVIDPLDGVNTLWPFFGISNQILAAIALMLGTVVLLKLKRKKVAWVTMFPTVWLLICTLRAGYQKLFDDNPKIGFQAQAHKYQAALAEDKLLTPAKSMSQMRQIIFNDYVDTALAALFMAVVLSILFFGLRACVRALREAHPSSTETDNFRHQPAAA